MTSWYVNGLENIREVASAFLQQFGEYRYFAFPSDMGSGKTTFITEVLKKLGIDSPEGSPTYPIILSYKDKASNPVFHMDMYRIKNENEALDLGIEDYFEQGRYCFIEWPEKIQALLPSNCIWVYIRVNKDLSRTISVKV
jgi:tRNA threonylcarbamoyladenosine biosynthesis protein TsaE